MLSEANKSFVTITLKLPLGCCVFVQKDTYRLNHRKCSQADFGSVHCNSTLRVNYGCLGSKKLQTY
jgi:hypothetical protein